jgi:hypothetical protein
LNIIVLDKNDIIIAPKEASALINKKIKSSQNTLEVKGTSEIDDNLIIILDQTAPLINSKYEYVIVEFQFSGIEELTSKIRERYDYEHLLISTFQISNKPWAIFRKKLKSKF